MNNKLPALIAIAVIAVGVGTIGSMNVFGTSFSQPTDKTDDGMKLLGHVEIVAKDSDGNIKAYRQTDNTVTNVGKTCVALRIFGGNGTQTTGCGGTSNTNKFVYIGIGTDATAEAATQTDLVAAFENRGFASAVGLNGNTTAPYSSVQRTLLSNGTGTIQESGLFDQVSSGHMFARKTFTGIGLNSGDSLTITWRVAYS